MEDHEKFFKWGEEGHLYSQIVASNDFSDSTRGTNPRAQGWTGSAVWEPETMMGWRRWLNLGAKCALIGQDSDVERI